MNQTETECVWGICNLDKNIFFFLGRHTNGKLKMKERTIVNESESSNDTNGR